LRFTMLERLHQEGIAHPPAAGAVLDTKQLEAAFANLARSIEEGRDEGRAERKGPKRVVGRS
jgi:hypothetical protein